MDEAEELRSMEILAPHEAAGNGHSLADRHDHSVRRAGQGGSVSVVDKGGKAPNDHAGSIPMPYRLALL